ncbi:hypothetical protein Tco_1260835 [Tanacetum coccineum]
MVISLILIVDFSLSIMFALEISPADIEALEKAAFIKNAYYTLSLSLKDQEELCGLSQGVEPLTQVLHMSFMGSNEEKLSNEEVKWEGKHNYDSDSLDD